ncbi:MAG: phage tail tape measure protein [Alistipes sp.]|nr:phage tail tape measure protein [Alistipes sp.]
MDEKTLYDRLTRDFAEQGSHSAQGALAKLLPNSMRPVAVEKWGIDPATKAAQITREQKQALVDLCKHWQVPVSALGDKEHAVITAGGVDVREVDPKTMASKLCAGLYFAGEVLAADQMTGAVNTANTAWQQNTALTNEANKRYATAQSRLTMMQNAYNNLKVAIGDAYTPALSEAYGVGTKVLNSITAFIQKNPALVNAITAFAGVIGAVVAALAAYAVAAKIAAAASAILTAAIPGVNVIMGVTAAVAAITAGIVALATAAANDAVPSVKELTEAAVTRPVSEGNTLAPYRGSMAFEAMRLHVDRSGKAPKAFMLTCGSLAMARARAQFSCNFFACAGIKVIDNTFFKSIEEGVKAALESKAEIVVVCASDDDYAEAAPKVKELLGDKAILVVAGAPACMPELEAQGIKNFINVKSNVLETLKFYLKEMGI